jgi:hypothetical protein
MRLNDFENANPDITPGKVFKWILIGILGLAVLGAVGWGIKLLAVPGEVVSKVVTADKIIDNYEWYEAQYAEINATVAKVNAFYKMHKTEMSEMDKVNVSGMTQYLESIVGTYNGKAKMITRNLWKAKDAPHSMKVIYGENSAGQIDSVAINTGEN